MIVMATIIYTKPACVQCSATYRALSKQGISFEVVDLTENPDALTYVKELGYQQAPVVVTDDRHWSGFRPDLIKSIPIKAAATH